MKILLKIRYIGTAYCGFQCQKNGVAVQNVMTAAAEKVFGMPCLVTGCSRTDSGVHALEFCCTAEPSENPGGEWCRIPAAKIHRAFSAVLPGDISVIAAAEVDDEFHPRYSCKGKNYIYRIWDAPWSDPFEAERSGRCIFRIDDEGIEKMQKAAKAFVGRHRFDAFMASGSKIEDTEREVLASEVYRESGGAVVFSVSADGFLYNMVRIMAGTLIDVAAGRIAADSIADIIASGDRSRAGQTAAACGLYLNEVFYDEDINWQCL